MKLMAAQFVKPYVKSNKSDFLDAAAIAEAVSRPTMRFVAPKTPAQQDLQALHRIRSLLVGQRTAQINQLRAFLLEDGITIPQGVSAFRLGVPAILADAANGLSPRMREMMTDLWRRIQELDGRIGAQTGAIVSPGPRTIRPANGSSRFRGSDRSRPPRWWPPWATGRRSGGDGNWPPFSGSCPASMPPGGNPGSSASPSEATATSAVS